MYDSIIQFRVSFWDSLKKRFRKPREEAEEAGDVKKSRKVTEEKSKEEKDEAERSLLNVTTETWKKFLQDRQFFVGESS
jgi:hypothetical protein